MSSLFVVCMCVDVGSPAPSRVQCWLSIHLEHATPKRAARPQTERTMGTDFIQVLREVIQGQSMNRKKIKIALCGKGHAGKAGACTASPEHAGSTGARTASPEHAGKMGSQPPPQSMLGGWAHSHHPKACRENGHRAASPGHAGRQIPVQLQDHTSGSCPCPHPHPPPKATWTRRVTVLSGPQIGRPCPD